MKKLFAFLVILLISIIFIGCGNKTEEHSMYQKITAKEAKNIMDTETGFIILDVRTEEEFATGHINNAILIPDYEIEKKAEDILKDKNQKILVYCRSGNRSAGASKTLIKLGYKNVFDFGGIIDWDYETVK